MKSVLFALVVLSASSMGATQFTGNRQALAAVLNSAELTSVIQSHPEMKGAQLSNAEISSRGTHIFRFSLTYSPDLGSGSVSIPLVCSIQGEIAEYNGRLARPYISSPQCAF